MFDDFIEKMFLPPMIEYEGCQYIPIDHGCNISFMGKNYSTLICMQSQKSYQEFVKSEMPAPLFLVPWNELPQLAPNHSLKGEMG